MNKISTAVILAAGKSTRTYPITLDIPKPLLKVLNVPIIHRTLQELEGIVEEVILIVGNKKEMIQDSVGSKFGSIKVKYVEQPQLSGTGSALMQVRDRLKGRFLVLNGDDIYKRSDILEVLQHKYAVLAQKVNDPTRFGVFMVDNSGNLVDLVEKPQQNIGNLVNAGCYLFDDTIFDYELHFSPRGEYEITEYLMELAKDHPVRVVPVQNYWLALGYSWDLLKINQYVLKHDFGDVLHDSTLPEHVHVYEKVRIGKNVSFGKNVHLVGPVVIGDNVTIGNHAYILPMTVLENNVTIEDECLVAESLIMDGSYLHRDAKRRGALVLPKYTISLNA